MRSEQEMFALILRAAEKDERIRAVYMNGSRTNPNAPKDIFQDYDIVYVVTETASFLKDKKWIDRFGDLLILQEPDQNLNPIEKERSYGYLMLFTDGNRIDLHIEMKEVMMERYVQDQLTIPLLDKDHILPSIPAPTDRDYWVKKPTEALFMSCCNDFWWCLQNVAKGIWRDELPYARQMFESVVRARLDEMVSWWIGTKHVFSVSAGKMGKYFKTYLPEIFWQMYEKTYSDHRYDHFWNSLFAACDLFRALAIEAAEQLSFTYPNNDDTNMMKFLRRVKELPGDAMEIF